MKFTIYNPSTGEILRLVDCPESDSVLQLFDGESLIAGWHIDSANYIENGQVIAIPEKPTKHHIFDYSKKQWVDTRTPETEWPLIRAERDRRLKASDWTQLPDVPLATKEAWATYRQALRDITEQPDPFNITWPAAPTQG